MNNKGAIIFVEGQTDYCFVDKMSNFLIEKNNDRQKVDKIIIKNLQGNGNFQNKAARFFKSQCAKYPNLLLNTICLYDTDAFDMSRKPPVNWPNVMKKLRDEGAGSVDEIKVRQMIEDWFLIDKVGLCKFLQLDPKRARSISGKDGNEKMKMLFRKKGKIYQKGSYCYDFLPCLDLSKIYSNKKAELVKLENIIFY
ncbi:MAG: hypothetical protein ABF649_20960 [Bacillus sp. (in: firmicutes)]